MKKMPTGYGMVQTEVMKLKGLSIEAKAIYCLLASYTGSKEYCFPKIETMCEDLGVSEQRFYKHIRQLKEKNLIKITKLYGDMRNNNKYEIGYIDTPQNICLQHPQNEGVGIPQNEGVGIPQNEGVINSISINNNRGIEEKPRSLKLKHKKEMEIMYKRLKRIINKDISELEDFEIDDLNYFFINFQTLRGILNSLKDKYDKIKCDCTGGNFNITCFYFKNNDYEAVPPFINYNLKVTIAHQSLQVKKDVIQLLLN
jgi:hypothetical protein